MKVLSVEVKVTEDTYKISNYDDRKVVLHRNGEQLQSFSSTGDRENKTKIIHNRIFGKNPIGFDMEYMLLLSIVSMLMDG